MKCKLFMVVLAVSFLFLGIESFAEVTSNPCPYSCKILGIDKAQCKDWKEGAVCYVDDLRVRPERQPTEEELAALDRKIMLVKKTVLAGKTINVSIPGENKIIEHFYLVAKRSGGTSETSLNISVGDSIDLGSKQVDFNEETQVIHFAANGLQSKGRNLKIKAENGDVFVESVHILRQKS